MLASMAVVVGLDAVSWAGTVSAYMGKIMGMMPLINETFTLLQFLKCTRINERNNITKYSKYLM